MSWDDELGWAWVVVVGVGVGADAGGPVRDVRSGRRPGHRVVDVRVGVRVAVGTSDRPDAHVGVCACDGVSEGVAALLEAP